MAQIMDVRRYLAGPEELRPQELIWGVVREPPAPWCDHQAIVSRALVLLATHVSAHDLGRVLVSPVDVVLDEEQALVVQPDIVFVSSARLPIVRHQIWGAPDLVVEVLSQGTRHHDLTNKRTWYQQYGVREYWILDTWARIVHIVSFNGAGPDQRRIAQDAMPVVSDVLPDFHLPAREFFVGLD